MNIIWESCVDYKYRCYVNKLNEFEGTLNIQDLDKKQTIFSTAVELNNNINKNDIQNWQREICNFLDS